jgi:hypothetical protein
MNPQANMIKPGIFLACLLAGAAALSTLAQSEPAAAHPAAAPPAQTATNAPSASPGIPPSVFIVPTSDSEGRDPFFPDDSLQVATPTQGQTEAPRTVELSLQGFSGEGDHRLAIINDQNFSAGEQGFVTTSSGRVSVHCIELKTNSVIVEVEGVRRELRFRPDQ